MSNNLTIEKAIQIPLEVWQDPQGNVILHVSERECMVYFGCWNEDSTPADYIGEIMFYDCWSTTFTYAEYIEYEYENSHHSYILSVLDSLWLNSLVMKNKRIYPNSIKEKEDYKHFVVKGHDVYVEVMAKDFTLKKLNREQAGEYAWLIDEA